MFLVKLQSLGDNLSVIGFRELQVAIRQHMNPLFKLQEVILMSSLPRTSSNKLMRRVLRDKLQMPRMHHASKL
jgi:acyl-coenzyme A synthetase/AMP-(fatty) acid ligase